MTNKDELFKALMTVDEDCKASILARLFGRFETIEKRERNRRMESDEFFSLVEEMVRKFHEKNNRKGVKL